MSLKEKSANTSGINTWKQFARQVRSRDTLLLKELDRFPRSVLVTGCQRSGTTALSRLITGSSGMIDFSFGKDDELDGASILSGSVDYDPVGRYCFQTTYLNDCYREYFSHQRDNKIIWVLRNPFSVFYSLLHNWKRFPLKELFLACGAEHLPNEYKVRFRRYGLLGVSRLHKACLSYVGKVSQALELIEGLGTAHIKIVEYDDVTKNKSVIAPEIYRFIDPPYEEEYANRLHSNSLDKASLLSKKEHSEIEHWCRPLYRKALELCEKQ